MLDIPQEPIPPGSEWSLYTVGDLQRALEGIDPNLPVRVSIQNAPAIWAFEDEVFGVRDLRRVNTVIVQREDKRCVDITVTDADHDLAPDDDLT